MTDSPPTPSTDAQPETTDATETFTERDDSTDAHPDLNPGPESPEPTTPTEPGSAATSKIDLDPSTIRCYLAWGALALCSLLVVVATIQFYGSVTTAIDLWVADRYQPLMRAAFNLVVVLASLTGISLVLRELS